MAYPYTETGYNMFDMLSMIQKAIRRGDYEHAGFAAYQLKGSFRTTMWNRLFVISAEDCFGVLTKELVALREQDEKDHSDTNLANVVALMCSSKKSRDACYFACNFILDSRKPRKLTFDHEAINEFSNRFGIEGETVASKKYDSFGFAQMSIFDSSDESEEEEPSELCLNAMTLQKALLHRDMDMIGYSMDMLRRGNRDLLWNVILDYAIMYATDIVEEIDALRIADEIVNRRKKDLEKDEIFISKAAVLLCHRNDSRFPAVESGPHVQLDRCIEWSDVQVKPIAECSLKNGIIPDWVYDCHTLKGRKMGKTDWDMTTTEQNALYPKQPAYFDEASWIYTYEQDFRNGSISEAGIRPIREYAKTHEANPVPFIPYE